MIRRFMAFLRADGSSWTSAYCCEQVHVLNRNYRSAVSRSRRAAIATTARREKNYQRRRRVGRSPAATTNLEIEARGAQCRCCSRTSCRARCHPVSWARLARPADLQEPTPLARWRRNLRVAARLVVGSSVSLRDGE